MAPKKKEVQKLSYGEFMADDSFGGSWADEVEEFGTQPLPMPDRRTTSSYSSYGNDRGYAHRDPVPQRIPDKPPYLAHLGNLDYDIMEENIRELLEGCDVTSIRLIEDRETKRPKGFGYAEFAQVEGLKQALELDGTTFRGRSIRVKIADPPKDRGDRGDFNRDISDWTRKGPLPDLPSRGGDRRGPSDFSERRAPRELGDEKPREFTWERKGPLSPLPQQDRPDTREGSRSRAQDGDLRGNRRSSPAAWGEGRSEGARAPRRDFSERPERPERVPTAAEKDMQWRSNMRPDAPAVKSPAPSRSGSEAPPSPGPGAAMPGSRPRLHLAKRTVTETSETTSAVTADAKSSPFGAARPINTAAREREIEERRQTAIKEKKEADEKAKEEHRKAKEAAAAAAAAAKVAEEEAKAAAKEEAAKEEAAKAAAAEEKAAESKPEEAAPAATAAAATTESPNGQKVPIRAKEPREDTPAAKTRAAESGNWRQPSGEQRGHRGGHRGDNGPRRGGGAPRGPRHDGPRPPRTNGGAGGPPSQPSTPKGGPEEGGEAKGPDEEGWETVPNKGRRSQKPRQ